MVLHRLEDESKGEDEHVLLHGDMILPFRLVAERRTKLKKWDVVIGRAAPNYGKLYAAQGHKWVVLHVLRVNSGFRKQFELRAMAIAEREMAQRGLALHAPPRQEVINPVLSRDARESGRGTSVVEQEAGLVIERVLDDGKSRFRGVVCHLPHASPCATPDLAHAPPHVPLVISAMHAPRHQVGVVDEGAEWAVVSSNVFLEFSYVRSKWGSVALGDVVHGLMVPDRKGGCDWRCIHVFKVDVGGAEAIAANAAVEAQLAREEQERCEKSEALAKQDHKAEVEKLKEAMRIKREEERRKKEDERRERLASKAKGR